MTALTASPTIIINSPGQPGYVAGGGAMMQNSPVYMGGPGNANAPGATANGPYYGGNANANMNTGGPTY